MLVAQRTEKYDNLANSAARRVSPDENKKSTPSSSSRRNPTSGSRTERNCARQSVQRYVLRLGTVVRYTGLHTQSPDRMPRGIRPPPCMGENSGYRQMCSVSGLAFTPLGGQCERIVFSARFNMCGDRPADEAKSNVQCQVSRMGRPRDDANAKVQCQV